MRTAGKPSASARPGGAAGRIIQLIVDVIVFSSTGMIALALFWVSGPRTVITGMCGIGEIGLLLLLTVEFLTHSDIFFTRQG